MRLQAVPVAEPEWSGGHKGLCLYVGRLLQPLWESAVIGPAKPGDSILNCLVDSAALEVRIRPLRLPKGAAFLPFLSMSCDAYVMSVLSWCMREGSRSQGNGPAVGPISDYQIPICSG